MYNSNLPSRNTTTIIEYVKLLPTHPKLMKAVIGCLAMFLLIILVIVYFMIAFFFRLSELEVPSDIAETTVADEFKSDGEAIKFADYEGIESVQEQFANTHLIERNENYDLSDYDKDGFPTGRLWLTAAEFKGKHIKDEDNKKRFNVRKKKQMASFVALIMPRAKMYGKEYDVPYQTIVAQAILESAYGTSRVAVTGSNYFGHKLTPAERRKYEEQGTAGFSPDIAGFIPANDDDNKDQFRQYVSIWAGMKRHAELLSVYKKTNGGGFPDCLCGKRNYASNCAGSYVDKIRKTMQRIP